MQRRLPTKSDRLFEHYRSTRRVYAVDLPGFGHAERSERRYDIALYTDAIDAVTAHITDETSQAIDALALSLAAEFLARAAVRSSAHYRRLALVTPTGFMARDADRRGSSMASREIAWLSALLSSAWVGPPAFRLLTRPGTIRYFLKRTWGSDEFDEGLADYDVLTTRQPGAHHAPLAFVSGRLFSRDTRSVYESLTLPVFLGHGTRGDFRDFRGAAWTSQRENWTRVAFASGAFPHFEIPDTFFAALDSFLATDDSA